MLFVCRRLRVMNDLVHGLGMGEFISRRETEWRLLNVMLLVVIALSGGIAGGDVSFGVRHASCCIVATARCGAPSFLSLLVL